MNPHDTFERCIELLYEASLDVSGNSLSVVEGFDDDVRVHFARCGLRGPPGGGAANGGQLGA